MKFEVVKKFFMATSRTVFLAFKHLKTNIRQIINDIPLEMCKKVVENYLNKID